MNLSATTETELFGPEATGMNASPRVKLWVVVGLTGGLPGAYRAKKFCGAGGEAPRRGGEGGEAASCLSPSSIPAPRRHARAVGGAAHSAQTQH
jgi:hypothetical protein